MRFPDEDENACLIPALDEEGEVEVVAELETAAAAAA